MKMRFLLSKDFKKRLNKLDTFLIVGRIKMLDSGNFVWMIM